MYYNHKSQCGAWQNHNIRKNNCSYNLITSFTKLTGKNAQKPSGIFLISLPCAPRAISHSWSYIYAEIFPKPAHTNLPTNANCFYTASHDVPVLEDTLRACLMPNGFGLEKITAQAIIPNTGSPVRCHSLSLVPCPWCVELKVKVKPHHHICAALMHFPSKTAEKSMVFLAAVGCAGSGCSCTAFPQLECLQHSSLCLEILSIFLKLHWPHHHALPSATLPSIFGWWSHPHQRGYKCVPPNTPPKSTEALDKLVWGCS